jgi:hypothetical protein
MIAYPVLKSPRNTTDGSDRVIRTIRLSTITLTIRRITLLYQQSCLLLNAYKYRSWGEAGAGRGGK